MEEDVKVKTNFFTNALIWIKSHVVVVAIIAAILVVAIILLCIFSGGPKRAVKSFINGMNSKNASKIISSIDLAGMLSWKSSYDVKDFDKDDYKEFIDSYKDIDKDDIKDEEDDLIDILDDEFDSIDNGYKTYKFKIEEIKSVKKLGNNLYAVKVKISLKAKPKDSDEDDVDKSTTTTFVVYKNKIISSDLL